MRRSWWAGAEVRWGDSNNGPAGDLPPCETPRRTYVIASLPRTGSTLLGHLLRGTGLAGDPKEYLNPMQVRDWQARLAPSAVTRAAHRALPEALTGLAGRGRWTEDRLRAHLDAVRARRTGPTGWFGLKLHHHHARAWFLDRGWSLDDHLAPTRWVRVVREDVVAQAVSWSRALQTGRWASWQPGRANPVYLRAAIDRRLAAIAAGQEGWDTLLGGVPALTVTYEALVDDPVGQVRRVLRWLDLPDDVDVPPPPTRPQGDAESAAWCGRYRAGR